MDSDKSQLDAFGKTLEEWMAKHPEAYNHQNTGNGFYNPAPFFGGGCPSCGYCRHCGRGGHCGMPVYGSMTYTSESIRF